MFAGLRQQVRDMGETLQITVDSDKLKPKLMLDPNGDRVFSLTYEGEEYPCMPRAWTSWAQKVLSPKDDAARRSHGMMDEMTGRRKRWSTTTVRKFLEMTPIDLAQDMITNWWVRHDPAQWNIIKYADNGKPGPIRFVGTNRYRLYKHEEFLNDLAKSPFAGMHLQDSVVTENRMVVRVTDNEPLHDLGHNVFAGYHLMNSENGSSAIVVAHMIYDLICTNGMMEMFEKNKIVSQKHTGFDMDEFRAKVVEISETMDELHEKSLKLVRDLMNFSLDRKTVDAILRMYRREYEASQLFIQQVNEVKINNLWQLVSAITNKSQQYEWANRLTHESNAGRLLRDVLAGKHLKYIEEEKQEELPNG